MHAGDAFNLRLYDSWPGESRSIVGLLFQRYHQKLPAAKQKKSEFPQNYSGIDEKLPVTALSGQPTDYSKLANILKNNHVIHSQRKLSFPKF